ncbi:hypothetical protein AD998_18800 [bacterium 336/3]|nr:hypothetical protein AD998_18800 [bacterium 336/3]
MRYILLFICSIIIGHTDLLAQPGQRIQQARKEYVIKRLGLTAEQEKKFVPLYDEYSKKQHELQKQIRQLRFEANSLALSDAELSADVDKLLELKQKDLDLEKEYLNKFKTILNIKQVVEMYKAEKDFVRVVLKGLRDKG